MKFIPSICILGCIFFSLLILAGCGDENVVKPEPETVPKIPNMTFSHKEVELETPYNSHGNHENTPVKMRPNDKIIVEANDNNEGFIRFTTDDFDLGSIKGLSASGTLPRLSFFGVGNEVSIPATFVPHAYLAYNDKDGAIPQEKRYEYACENWIDTLGVHASVSLKIRDGKISGVYVKDINDYVSLIENKISYNILDEYVSCSYNLCNIPTRSNSLHYVSSPFDIKWSSPAYPEEIEKNIPQEDFLQTLINTPFLNEGVYGFDNASERPISISNLMSRLCSGILFYSDRHSSVEGEMTWFASCDKLWDDERRLKELRAVSPFKSEIKIGDIKESTMRLYVDPEGLFNVRVPREIDDTSFDYVRHDNNTPAMLTLIYNLITAVSPANIDGILMNYEFYGPEDSEGKSTRFKMNFADRALAISFLKALLLPLLKDEDNYGRLMKSWKSDEVTAPCLEDLKYVADHLEEILDATTTLDFGWAFSRGATTSELQELGRKQYQWLYSTETGE